MHDSARSAELRPPPWALDAVADGEEGSIPGVDEQTIRVRSKGRFALLSTSVPAAGGLTSSELEQAVREGYLRLLDVASRLPACHLVRVWNQIPGILEPLDDLEHRYLAFNAGRFHAYREFYGERFFERAPTASGVGAPGGELMIHALAASEACRPLQNPRQWPSHRYSESYGSCPPCFARGVRLASPESSPWLVAGGTASVRGEETVHPADLEGQTDETLLNLATLVDVARRGPPAVDELGPDSLAERLGAFRFLRVYYVEAAALPRISAWVSRRFGRLEAVEYVRTELCRDDLLIEIEGVAELDSTG